MEEQDGPFREWHSLLAVWKSGQVGLPRVQRWSKYMEDAECGVTRPQDSLQHSYSLVTLGIIFLQRIRPHLPHLDAEMLLTALHVHDHSEAELGMDILYVDKTEAGDLNEYHAFVKRFAGLCDSPTFRHFHRAFLLQFARKNPAIFPPKAQAEMAYLRRHFLREIIAFEAVERWDYLLFPLEQYMATGNAKMLVQVLRNHAGHLSRIAIELPGFGETIWTPEIRMECAAILGAYDGKWIECPKKERVAP